MSVLHPATLREVAVHKRIITIDRLGKIDVNDDPDQRGFSCAITARKSGNVPGTDASPRGNPKLQLWWRPQNAPLEQLGAGHRVEVSGEVYEMTSNPRAMRAGPKTYGWWAEMLPLSELYGFDGTVHDMGRTGDNEALVELPVSVWLASGTDRVTGRAFYQDPSGEAPVEFYDDLRGENRKLKVGGQVYSITNVSINTKGFFVAMSLTTGTDSGWRDE